MMTIKWTDRQLALLRKAAPLIDPTGDLDDDTIISLIEQTGDYLVLYCLDEHDEPTREGLLCESIIDLLCDS